MSEAVAIIVASLLSALVALAVVFVQSELTRRLSIRQTTMERLAEYAAAIRADIVRTRTLAFAPMSDKAELAETELYLKSADRVNDIGARIGLLDSLEVIAAAAALGAEASRLERVAMSRQWSDSDWLQQRESLSDLMDQFQRVARHQLKSPELPQDSPRYIRSTPFDISGTTA